MDKKIKLSICMIVKDEEKNLDRCLVSLQPLMARSDVELVVVDTGSTDKTVEIAQRYTQKVYFHAWNGNFSEMRNISISYATGEWLFIIDADEELQDPEKLSLLLDRPELLQFNTIVIKVKNFISSDYSIFIVNKSERLFRNNGFCYQGSVHNQPQFQGPILSITDVFLNHYGYNSEDAELMEKKFQRTSTLLINELKKDPQNIYYHFQLCRTYSMHDDLQKAYDQGKVAYSLLKEKDTDTQAKYIYVFNEFVRMACLLGKYEEAREVCYEGLNINENYIDLQYYLGYCHEKLRDEEAAYESRTKFLQLHKKFTEDGFEDNGLIELYKLDDNSKYEILFKIAHYHYNQKDYVKAEEHLQKVIDNEAKIRLYTKVLLDGRQFTRLREYYDSLPEEFKNRFITDLETHRKTVDKEEQIQLSLAFKEGEGRYYQFNNVRAASTDKAWVEAKAFLAKYDMNEIPLFYAEVFEPLMQNSTTFWQELKKLKSTTVRKVIKELIDLNAESKIPLRKLLSEVKLRQDDYQGNRIYICVSYVLLIVALEDDTEVGPDKDQLFSGYIEHGLNCIQFYYQMDRIRLIYKTLENEEEQFFILMYLYKQAIETNNMKVAIKYISEATSVYPVMSPFLKYKTNLLNVRVQKEGIIHSIEVDAEKHDFVNSGSMASLSVLHGTMEIANQMNHLVTGLKNNNVYARSLNFSPSYLGYQCDYTMDLSKINDTEEIQKSTLEILEKSVQHFNVFHFHFGTSMLPNLSDLLLLKQAGKKVFMHHWGSDVRMKSIATKLNPFIKVKDQDEEQIKRLLSYLGQHIDHCIVADAELYEYVKGYYKKVSFIRQAIDTTVYRPAEEYEPRKNKPTIVHAPTSPEYKGTKYIMQAIENLKSKYDFNFTLIQNTSHEEAKKIYQDADIILDQILGGSHGLLSLEAMAMRKPVICYIADFMKEFYPKELPIVSANPETITEKIEMLLKDFELRKELGMSGRKYVETYHDLNKVSAELIDLYLNEG
ncbi:glycosyltransferase involved in cell wall biosynthesis [Brevibacillus sp. AG162]|uniref:glycosyltransferase n=1 Tax=Brevibacillus sp. AG162 TaxID=2572910 RepID=UPI0011512752|nr:glycosyltransferase [Brevibacillus sp. AG162]TQK63084.1 glycosyltransferase involved in cell wall biosynthesis [Brevibacillus sp. AG162]